MVRANFCSGLICPRAQTCMDSKVVHADFGSRLICPRAQTCMDSKVVHADFGSRLICPRAQTCCAELRRLARLANSPGFKSFRCPRWRIKFSLERFSDPSRICLRLQPLESSLGRVPQAPDFRTLYCLKWATSVEIRHGLPISEARLCSACANPLACPAVEKFCRASSAGGRRHL